MHRYPICNPLYLIQIWMYAYTLSTITVCNCKRKTATVQYTPDDTRYLHMPREFERSSYITKCRSYLAKIKLTEEDRLFTWANFPPSSRQWENKSLWRMNWVSLGYLDGVNFQLSVEFSHIQFKCILIEDLSLNVYLLPNFNGTAAY